MYIKHGYEIYEELLQTFFLFSGKKSLIFCRLAAQTSYKSEFNNCVYWRLVFTRNCEIEMKIMSYIKHSHIIGVGQKEVRNVLEV